MFYSEEEHRYAPSAQDFYKVKVGFVVFNQQVTE